MTPLLHVKSTVDTQLIFEVRTAAVDWLKTEMVCRNLVVRIDRSLLRHHRRHSVCLYVTIELYNEQPVIIYTGTGTCSLRWLKWSVSTVCWMKTSLAECFMLLALMSSNMTTRPLPCFARTGKKNVALPQSVVFKLCLNWAGSGRHKRKITRKYFYLQAIS
jgi:hypothetical protein